MPCVARVERRFTLRWNGPSCAERRDNKVVFASDAGLDLALGSVSSRDGCYGDIKR